MSKDISKTFDQLKPNIDEVKELASVFKLYYDKLEHMNFSGSNPYETELLLKYLKQINNDTSMSKHLQAFSKSTINLENPTQNEINAFASDAFNFYGALKANHYKLAEIHEIYETYKVEPFSGSYVSSATSMSKHDIEDMMKTFDYMQSNWNKYISNSRTMIVENTLSEYILASLQKPDLAIKTLEHIHKLYKSGTGLHLIDLYSNVLTHASEVETKNNKATIQYVIQLVDELKAEVLPPISRQIGNRKTNTLQNLVQRYRMIPDGPSRSLAVLIEELTGVKISDDDPLSALSKVAKVLSKGRRYGFIVVAKIIPHPIEHNIWLLTDAAYLQKNNLSESSNSVTKTSIKRAQTIQNKDEVKPLIKDGIYRIDDTFEKDPKMNYYYVLQTLDGATFHILYPWYISIFAQKIYEIPASYLENFGEIKTGPSTRVETYNSIICNEILKHLKPPMIEQEVGLSKIERKRKEIQWAVIRKKIARSMLEDYEQLFEQHKPSATNIFSLILNPNIFQNALHYIIQGVSSTIESMKKQTGTYYSEIYMAALSDLYKLRSNMSQEVENIYNEQYKDKLDKLLKSGDSTRTVIKIVDLLENILLEMLEKYINEKSNVYSIIQQKIEMLELVYA